MNGEVKGKEGKTRENRGSNLELSETEEPDEKEYESMEWTEGCLLLHGKDE